MQVLYNALFIVLQRTNTCPCDRKPFDKILVQQEMNGPIMEVDVPEPSNLDNEVIEDMPDDLDEDDDQPDGEETERLDGLHERWQDYVNTIVVQHLNFFSRHRTYRAALGRENQQQQPQQEQQLEENISEQFLDIAEQYEKHMELQEQYALSLENVHWTMRSHIYEQILNSEYRFNDQQQENHMRLQLLCEEHLTQQKLRKDNEQLEKKIAEENRQHLERQQEHRRKLHEEHQQQPRLHERKLEQDIADSHKKYLEQQHGELTLSGRQIHLAKQTKRREKLQRWNQEHLKELIRKNQSKQESTKKKQHDLRESKLERRLQVELGLQDDHKKKRRQHKKKKQ